MACTTFPSTGLVPGVTTHVVGSVTYRWSGIVWEAITAPLTAESITNENGGTVQEFVDSFALKIFQSPTDGGLTEIQTRTLSGGEVYEVRKVIDNSLATIYADKNGNVEIQQNGINNVSGSDGVVTFFIADGNYTITADEGVSNFNVLSSTLLIKRVTTAEAILENGKAGSVYYLTDRGHEFEVVETVVPATGGETIQLVVNKVLKLLGKNGQDINIEAFGVSDSVDSTNYIIEALNSGYRLYGDTEKEYLYSSATKGTITKSAHIKDINISFGASFDGYILEFQNSVQQYNCNFNFNNNYYCNASGRQPAPIAYLGKRLVEQNCTYKNLLGIQDRFQYACKILSNTITESTGSEYENIIGVTNTAGTSGFCGGVLVSTNPDDLGNVIPSSHTFKDMRGTNVKTIANGSAVRFPDSDLIRYYAYEFETPGIYLIAEDAVRKTSVTVDGQYCMNVLKSGAKLAYCAAKVQNSEFYVTDDDGQDLVFAPWRYQQGDKFTCKNVTAIGSGIANAVVASGKINTVSNVTFSSDYVNATAVFCGGNADSVVNVSDIHTEDCAYILQLSTAIKTTANRLYNNGQLRNHVVRYINTGDAEISKVRIDNTPAGLIDSLNGSSVFESIKFKDVQMESSTTAGLISQHEGGGKLKIEDSEFTGTYTRIVVGAAGLSEFTSSNTTFRTDTLNTNQILVDFNGLDKVAFINGSQIIDNRGNKTVPVVRVTGNKQCEFSNFKYKALQAGTGVTFLQATGDGTDDFKWSSSEIDSLDPMGTSIDVTGYRVARINDLGIRLPNDLNGVVDLAGNTASTVDGIYGNIKATGAVIGADSVINEVKIV